MVDKKDKNGNVIKNANGRPKQVMDLTKKLYPIMDCLRNIFMKYRNPPDEFVSIDESLRGSFSKRDPLR